MLTAQRSTNNKHTELIKFKLIEMPCCGQLLCWVNPRLPTHCPECGKHVLLKLRTGEHFRINDENARLIIHD